MYEQAMIPDSCPTLGKVLDAIEQLKKQGKVNDDSPVLIAINDEVWQCVALSGCEGTMGELCVVFNPGGENLRWMQNQNKTDD